MSTASVNDAASSADASSLRGFWRPRYWTTWLFIGWLKLTASLPWRVAIALHMLLGRVVWQVLPSRRRIVLRNLELCFPDLDAAERDALARQFFANFAASIAEIGIAWFGTAPRSRPPVRVEGLEHLEAALARGRGAILYSGHFTTLELTTQFIDDLTPSFAFMFKERSNALLDAVQARGRQRTARQSFSISNARGMLRLLERNGAIWYAPDQAHTGRNSLLLPFFWEPAMANTGTVRLARLSGAAIVPLFFRRLPKNEGYLLRFEPALANLPSDDVEADQRRLVEVLERFVRECPEQYLWTHRKFKGRPGLPDPYRRTTPSSAAPTLAQRLAAPFLCVAVALFAATVQSDLFWQTTLHAAQIADHRELLLGSVFTLVLSALTLVRVLAPRRLPLKAAAALLLVGGAVYDAFISDYGIRVDVPLLRAAIDTTLVARPPLFDRAFFWHVLWLGVLPAALVALVPLPRQRWMNKARIGVALLSVAALFASLYVNFYVVSRVEHAIRAPVIAADLRDADAL